MKNIEENFKVHPIYKFAYGTAGFRGEGNKLDDICYRMGQFASILSKLNGFKAFGVMITASHNPIQDNGIKIINSEGGMMESEYEPLCELFACPSDSNSLTKFLEFFQSVSKKSINEIITNKSRIIIGYDTRPTSSHLAKQVEKGAQKMSTECFNLGEITTPQCHFMVYNYNINSNLNTFEYVDRFSNAFLSFIQNIKIKATRIVLVDCADGIGGKIFPYFVNKIGSSIIKFNLINDGKAEGSILNESCGSEFVQVKKTFPKNIKDIQKGIDYVSFDGDADRIMFYYSDDNFKLSTLDGDHVSILYCSVLFNLINKISSSGIKELDKLKIGLIQTAYANSSSTKYIKENFGSMLEISFVPTGVKHLEKKAKEYDLGIYFESNGHGTILFKNSKLEPILQSLIHKYNESNELKILLNFLQISNTLIGDAISNLLMIEASLLFLGLKLSEWNNFYSDIPSILDKMKVKNKADFKTVYDETSLVQPKSVQDFINEGIVKKKAIKCFVRPSGTEDYIRIYTEANTLEEAKKFNDSLKEFIISVNL